MQCGAGEDEAEWQFGVRRPMRIDDCERVRFRVGGDREEPTTMRVARTTGRDALRVRFACPRYVPTCRARVTAGTGADGPTTPVAPGHGHWFSLPLSSATVRAARRPEGTDVHLTVTVRVADQPRAERLRLVVRLRALP